MARVGKEALPGVRKASANRLGSKNNQRPPQAAGQPATGVGTKRSLVVRGGGDLKKIDAPKTKTINYSGSTQNFEGGAAAHSGNGNPWDAGLTMNSSA